MTTLLLTDTTELEIESILELENSNRISITPNSRQEHLNLISDKDISHLTLKSTKQIFLGFVILAGLENQSRNIEFRRIVIKEKGKGIIRIAIRKIKKHCFNNLNCHRLWLDVFENNTRAINLYKSEGFQTEGMLRDCIKTNGKYKSLVIMSILEDEYQKMESK